ncbi:hypothetical protein D3C83_46180 [compost metagenome]
MNWDRVEGNWRQLKGMFKEHWGELTDDQIDIIAGKRERLIGVLQESYGIAKDEAERRVKEWEKSERRAADFELALRKNGVRELA